MKYNKPMRIALLGLGTVGYGVYEFLQKRSDMEVACAMSLVVPDGVTCPIVKSIDDILSDESAAIAGSLGMMPSASLGAGTRGLYEPIHGSAPDIAGRDIANPLGTILSGALLLRHSLGLEKEAAAIEAAVTQVLDEGYRTGDIWSEGCTRVGCTQMGDLVAERI